MPNGPSDLDCATLMIGIYGYPGYPEVTWDYLDPGQDDGVCYGVKQVNGVPVVALRGSTTLSDWLRDFDCVANPFHDSDGLGPVHPGFLLGMDRVLAELGGTRGLVVTGHSLGAGRACILTGLLEGAGLVPSRRVCFGEPKPGFAELAGLVGKLPGTSYCAGDAKGHDLVTEVPFTLEVESYCHPGPLTHLEVTPGADDPWSVFAYHHMQGYYVALARGASK